jgi:hypothetical protein
MVVNRLQYGLIKPRIVPKPSRLNYPNIFFKYKHTFFSNSYRDFYSENNNVLSHVYTHTPNSKYFDRLALKSLGLYVILLSYFVAYLSA